MNRYFINGSGLLIATALFLAINIICNQTITNMRLDVTENRLYSLSEGTKNILESIEEPITIRLYFSQKAFASTPRLLSYGKRVKDMLEEYTAVGKDKVRLFTIDPESFSEAEDDAVAFGAGQISLNTAGEVGYLSIVGSNSTDRVEVLPILSPEKEDALEYELTKLIYRLNNPRERTIGVLSTLPVFAPPRDPATGQQLGEDWTAFALLKELYEVVELPLTTETILPNIDTIIVVHPKNLPEETIVALDQFVLRGGKAMIFVDPLAEQDTASPSPDRPAVIPSLKSELSPLLAHWGIALRDDKVIGDPSSAVRVSFRAPNGPQEVEYLPWLQLQSSNFNQTDFITNELSLINVGTAGSLSFSDKQNHQFSTLISTSKESGLMEANTIMFVRDPRVLIDSFETDPERHIISAKISGKFETAFPEHAAKSSSEQNSNPDFLKVSTQPTTIIVTADTDLLADKFWVRFSDFAGVRIPETFGNNGDFLVNAIDNLGGNDDLINLRSRGDYSRPFEVVNAIKRQAEAKFRKREQQLQKKLEETEKRLVDLQKTKAEGETLLSQEQKMEIQKFREEQIDTRKQLRSVQHELRRDIERLEHFLTFANTALIPIMIVLFAVGRNSYISRKETQHPV